MTDYNTRLYLKKYNSLFFITQKVEIGCERERERERKRERERCRARAQVDEGLLY